MSGASRLPSRNAASPLRGVLAAGLVGILACGDSPSAPETSRERFEAFWQSFDREYPYFQLKGVDWDQLRDQHSAHAEAATSVDELVEVLRDMTAPLRDIHVAFTSPAGERIPTYVPDAFVNWDRDLWLQLVEAAGWTQVKPNLGYASFQGVPYITIGAWNTAQFSSADFDAILEGFRSAPALILDVRPNGGGNDALALEVAARFAGDRVVFASVQYRDGPQHDDFGPRLDRTLSARGPWRYEGRVYVLAGRGVYSSNETFVAAMRELPEVTLVGDTTGGGSANPASHELGEGWTYTVSQWIERTADDIVIEGHGIPPDIFVPMTATDVGAGRDPVLERATELATSAAPSRFLWPP